MAKRIAIALCLLALTSCSGRVDQQKFEGVYRAGKAIEGALSVGVTYVKFGELVQAFATEVSIAKDKASNSAERDLVRLYDQALTACTDSLTIWKLKIRGSGSLDVSTNPDLRRIVDAYPIQGQGSGAYFNFQPDGAMQTIWSNVGAKLAAGTRLYNGEAASGDLPTPR